MRRLSAGSFQHLAPIQRQEFTVPRRPPRESINPVKSEDVIDSEHMKNITHSGHAPPPPGKLISAHDIPAINGDAPVLSPLLGKFIVLEIRLRRGAPGPVERE